MQRILACILLCFVLTGCGGRSSPSGTTTAGSPEPQAYHTASPSQTPSVLPPLTEVFLPTPTTFVYVVVIGDTLSGIAQRMGVSLEALMAANPGVQPTSLTVGTELVIPTGSEIPGEPTPTPAPLPVRQARCWPEAGGGLWCFALLQNGYAEALEDISAQFTLLGPGGSEIASQIVFGMLDVLPAGESMPLAAHFPAPMDPGAVPRLQLLTAIRLLPGDTRYLPAMLENTLVSVSASGRTAQASGRVVLTSPGEASMLWVLATAFDSGGNVVGLRRWESPSALTDAAPVSFDFLVSSLGPAIDRVTFLVEARP